MNNYLLKLSITGNVSIFISIIFLAIHFELPKKVMRYYFNVPNTNIVVMGDSRIDTNWNKLMDRNDIVSFHGSQIDDLLPQVESVTKLQPKLCLIMIGINDMFWTKTPKQTFEDFKLLIDKMLEKNMSIVIQSLIYVCPAKLFYREQNEEVDELNAMLKSFCKDKGILFFDINTKLSEFGYLKKEFSSDDVHINNKGYQVWKNELIPLFKTLNL